jgi:hypothetical protein
MLKKLVGGALCAVAVVGFGSSAFAGEITGSGKGGPNGDGKPAATQGHAQSACAFSGLDDAAAYHGDVQNFGHIDDPAFVSVVSIRGAAYVTATLDFHDGSGPFTIEIGCNPHAGAGG